MIKNINLRMPILLACLINCGSSQTNSSLTDTAGWALDVQYIGMIANNEVVFMSANPSNASSAENITFYYRWTSATSSEFRYENTFAQTFTPTSTINLVSIDNVEDLPILCVRLNNHSQELCQNLEDKNSHLDLPPPTNAHVASTNYNYSLLWDYEYPSLSKEISFAVELNAGINSTSELDWLTAYDCNLTRHHHCDLFPNDFLVDNDMCPEILDAGVVKSRVKSCLTARPSACGKPVKAKKFTVSVENVISPPNFKIMGLFNNNQLRIRNHPHYVAYSNKSLSCYYQDSLVYKIRFYGIDDNGFKSYEEFKRGFSETLMALKIHHIPVNNTIICVKMKIEHSFAPIVASDWNTVCQRVYTNEGKTWIQGLGVGFYVIFLACAAVILGIIIFVSYKARRLYKSMHDIEIPSELEELKRDIEKKRSSFSINIVSVKRFESNDFELDPTEIVDPLPSSKPLKRVFDDQTVEDMKSDPEAATHYFEDETKLEENSGVLHHSSETDSLSYVFQTQNGELIFKDLSQSSEPSNCLTHSSSFIFKSDSSDSDDKSDSSSFETKSLVNPSNSIKVGNVVANNRDLSSIDSQSHQSPSLQKHLVCFPDFLPRSSSFQGKLVSVGGSYLCGLSDDDAAKPITKLENPTYSSSSDPNGFCLQEAKNISLSTQHVSYCITGTKNARARETKIRPVSVNSCSSFEGSSVFSMQSTPTQNNSDPFSKSDFASLSLHRNAPNSSQKFLCLNQCSPSNKIDPGGLSIGLDVHDEPYPTQSNLTDFDSKKHQKKRKRRDSSPEPSYVTYERSRVDSCRSGDSGLPYDWTFSDDYQSPPQSPDDCLIPQCRKLSSEHGTTSFKGRFVDDSRSKVKITKLKENNSKFTYELQPIFSGPEESVFDEEKKFCGLQKTEDDYVVDPNHTVNSDYLKISVFSLKETIKNQTFDV